jgi:hypothetical protein
MPPARAILLECAFESPGCGEEERELEELIAHFKHCAEVAAPLEPHAGYVIFADIGEDCELTEDDAARAILAAIPPGGAGAVYTWQVPGDDITITAAPLGADSIYLDVPVGEDAVDVIRAADIEHLLPLAVGIGQADTESEARVLALRAMLRRADRHSPDTEMAQAERRVLAKLNRLGAAHDHHEHEHDHEHDHEHEHHHRAHTALTVGIESEGAGFVSVALGSAMTSYSIVMID